MCLTAGAMPGAVGSLQAAPEEVLLEMMLERRFMAEVRGDAPQGTTPPELRGRPAFSVPGLLNISPFSTTLLWLCLDLGLWPLLATVVSAFLGSAIPGTVTSIDQNHASVLLVLLLPQAPWVPLPGLQREEAGTQLASTAPAQPPA